MIYISRFRIGYWVQTIISVSFLFLIAMFSMFYPFDNIEIDLKDFSFWTGSLSLLFLIIYIRKFLTKDFKRFYISNEFIKVKYLINKKTKIIHYEDITGFKVNRNRIQVGPAGYTDGYLELEIETKDKGSFMIDAQMFDNFNVVKSFIYTKYYDLNQNSIS